jgi:hypothetical protein
MKSNTPVARLTPLFDVNVIFIVPVLAKRLVVPLL